MAESIPNSPRRDSRSFRQIVDAFLGGEGLPFAEVLSSDRIERVFLEHGGVLGLHGIYTTAIMVWSFLSQVLRDGKEASCQAAVARVVAYLQVLGLPTPSKDTGNYCRAREKLSCAALRELSCEIAECLLPVLQPSSRWQLHA